VTCERAPQAGAHLPAQAGQAVARTCMLWRGVIHTARCQRRGLPAWRASPAVQGCLQHRTLQ
jgi:hypothetical protein